MWKACSRCGKIHRSDYKCTVGKIYVGGDERDLRSTYKWTKKSREIREASNYLCEVCRSQGIYTYKDIEVHHIDKVRDDPDRLLDDDNLICLCQEHHKQADAGLIDPDVLRSLAKDREK